jgi:hypothetical protein
MALNKDFRVKDSLTTGVSGFFKAGGTSYNPDNVAIDTLGKILSAGRDLADIFADVNLADLEGGAGINTFVYDGSSNVTVSVSGVDTLTSGNLIKWSDSGFTDSALTDDDLTSLQTTVDTNSGFWSSVYTEYNAASANTVDGGSSPSQGTVRLNRLDGSTVDIDTGLQTTDSPQFVGVTATGDLQVNGNTTLGDGSGDLLTVNAGTITVPNLTPAVDDTVLILNSSNQVSTREINPSAWDTSATFLSGSGTANTIPLWNNAYGLTDSIVTQNAGATEAIVGGDMTVTGNLSVLGDFTYVDTTVSVTSALSVVNDGSGPALVVSQNGTEPVAWFIDKNDSTAVVIADTGKVGIGTYTPTADLTVQGSVSASGTITFDGISAATDNTVLILDTNNNVRSDEIDSRVWGSTLLDTSNVSGTTNTVAKFTGTNTVGDSSITDNGTTVGVGADVELATDKTLTLQAGAGTTDVVTKIFDSDVTSAGNPNSINTFSTTNLKSVKFNVTLVTGANRTSFEVLAVYNGTSAFGTVYAIIDAQASSLLTDVDTSVSGGLLRLDISVSLDCTAIINGTATYNS